MAVIHRRFRDFVFQPQCFPDMSFFPVHDGSLHAPKVLSSNGSCGITYVEINILSQHPFIQRVALLAGMWNFKADLWNEIQWPSATNIESLQLTLDYTSNIENVYLDRAPRRQQVPEIPDLPASAHAPKGEEIEVERGDTEDALEMVASEGEILNFKECISPTTRKAMDFKNRLRNLFFIRFDSSGYQPAIYFPKTLWGLGLQTFTSSTFSKHWWTSQIQLEQRFESLRFLVLSCCDFANDELQTLLENTKSLEHLSLRYVRWEGTIYLPQSLLSLGYFPDRHFTGYYSMKLCVNLWQVSTRLNENANRAIEFLNYCSMVDSIKRVKFEFIRKEQYADGPVDLDCLEKWENRDNDGLTVAIEEQEFENYPILREIFPIPKENFVSLQDVKFEDCPLWSDESRDFIHMTNKRKLLLR
eukprot:390692_1